MKHSSNNRSGLFLLEIIIAILFFAMVSAVCLRAFAKSHTLSRQASDTNYAISNMESIAELLKAVDSADLKEESKITETLQIVYPKVSVKDHTWHIYFDSDWKNCAENIASYQIVILADESNISAGLCSYELTAENISDNAQNTQIEQFTLKLHAKE